MISKGLVAAGQVLVVLMLLTAHPATAKEKKLGSFGVWDGYAYDEGGQTVCYMVTTHKIKSLGPQKRGASYLMITDRPIEASKDVISYGAGTNLNARHGVKLLAGRTLFELFSVKDTAWTRDSLTDHKVAAALKAFPSVQISALPDKKGSQPILDIFDLKGAPDAYTAIAKACGLLEKIPAKKSTKKAPTSRKK